MASTKRQPSTLKFIDEVPTDLRRLTLKGMDAIEACLDLRTKADVTSAEHQRAMDYAQVGAVPFSGAIRFMGAMNKRLALELALKQARAS